MTDYQVVRAASKKRGPLTLISSSPIPIQPSTEWSLTRLIVLPVMRGDDRVRGLYMRVPAVITVTAFSAGEASARADEIQANTGLQAWGNGSKPWDGDKTHWQEVPAPPDALLELR